MLTDFPPVIEGLVSDNAARVVDFGRSTPEAVDTYLRCCYSAYLRLFVSGDPELREALTDEMNVDLRKGDAKMAVINKIMEIKYPGWVRKVEQVEKIEKAEQAIVEAVDKIEQSFVEVVEQFAQAVKEIEQVEQFVEQAVEQVEQAVEKAQPVEKVDKAEKPSGLVMTTITKQVVTVIEKSVINYKETSPEAVYGHLCSFYARDLRNFVNEDDQLADALKDDVNCDLRSAEAKQFVVDKIMEIKYPAWARIEKKIEHDELEQEKKIEPVVFINSCSHRDCYTIQLPDYEKSSPEGVYRHLCSFYARDFRRFINADPTLVEAFKNNLSHDLRSPEAKAVVTKKIMEIKYPWWVKPENL